MMGSGNRKSSRIATCSFVVCLPVFVGFHPSQLEPPQKTQLSFALFRELRHVEKLARGKKHRRPLAANPPATAGAPEAAAAEIASQAVSHHSAATRPDLAADGGVRLWVAFE